MPIIITSKQDGFRRGGQVHTRTPTTWPDATFTPAQLDQIKADPMLTVEITKLTPAKGGKTTPKPGTKP